MLDINPNDPLKALTPLSSPLEIEFPTIFPDEDNFPKPQYSIISRHMDIQLRYVVHRQYIGFFTPMVFDISLEYLEDRIDSVSTKNTIFHFFEPFIEGALFMNHSSHGLVEYIKGKEAGINRHEFIQDLTSAIEGTDTLWYSDWTVPPPTKQGQRIVVYDVETTVSMLDPVAVLKYLISKINAKIHPHFTFITKVKIVGGYTNKIP